MPLFPGKDIGRPLDMVAGLMLMKIYTSCLQHQVVVTLTIPNIQHITIQEEWKVRLLIDMLPTLEKGEQCAKEEQQPLT